MCHVSPGSWQPTNCVQSVCRDRRIAACHVYTENCRAKCTSAQTQQSYVPVISCMVTCVMQGWLVLPQHFHHHTLPGGLPLQAAVHRPCQVPCHRQVPSRHHCTRWQAPSRFHLWHDHPGAVLGQLFDTVCDDGCGKSHAVRSQPISMAMLSALVAKLRFPFSICVPAQRKSLKSSFSTEPRQSPCTFNHTLPIACSGPCAPASAYLTLAPFIPCQVPVHRFTHS